MAASINGTFTLNEVSNGGVVVTLALPSASFGFSGANFKRESQTIPTTSGGTAISVSGLVTPRWTAIINRDVTNYVDILSAVSGTAFARLLPGEGMMLPLNPGITAPAAQANTSPCQIDILIIEA